MSGTPITFVNTGGYPVFESDNAPPAVISDNGIPVTLSEFGSPINLTGKAVDKFPVGGVLSDDVANLIDISGVSITGAATHEKAEYSLGESSRVTIELPETISGNYWVQTVQERAGGAFRCRFLSGTYQPEATRSVSGIQVWKFPSITSSDDIDFFTGSGGDATLKSIQAYDMAAILAQPCDVYIAMGQSLMACSTSSLGVDTNKDGWANTRILQWCGRTYSGYGTIRNALHACAAPLQMGDNEAHSANCSGVSPAISFAKHIENSTAAGRNVVIVSAAISGTGLTASDAPWNSGGSDPFAYNNAVTLTNAAMAALPVGSEIKGVLWAQGEADTSSDMSGYSTSFASMRSAFETAVNSGTQLPWIIIAGPPNATRANQAHFIQTQLNMDADSGHATAQTKVHTVERPIAAMEDSTHPAAENQRAAGKLAAELFIEKGYL